VKKWALKASPLFHNYENRELDQIALQFSTKFANDKVIIMDIDKPVDALIICIEGKISSKPVGTIFND
jgi:signal-transduction protein with cAMP-binding, CBS, and nucleotidyltransferase domain